MINTLLKLNKRYKGIFDLFVFRTQCATQFIHLLSSEANEICEKKHNKRTIAPEHAFTALENLGFGTMVKEGTNALNEYKSAVAKKRRKSHRLENLGIPVEELLKQQQELFAKVYFTQGCFFHMD